jgi:hypothetical protein
MLSPDFRARLGQALEGASISTSSMDMATSILVQLDREAMQGYAGLRGACERLGQEGTRMEPATGAAVNLIPGPYKVKCCDLLMAIGPGRGEFSKRLREAIGYCIDCLGITRGVIFVTDYWDNETFTKEHRSTFVSLNERVGVRLVCALLAGDMWSVVPVVP